MSESSRQAVVQRGAAALLVCGAAISLTVVSGGITPALADPTTETTAPTTAATAPTATVVPEVPATVVLEPQTQTTVPSEPTSESTTQAPTVTQAPEVVTTTAPSPTSVTTSATTTAASPSPGVNSETSTSVTTSSTATTQTSTATTTSGSSTPSTDVETAPTMPTATPQQLEATAQNVEIAKASIPLEQNPAPAPQSEIDSINHVLNEANPAAENSTTDWDGKVKQFQPDWVRYDNNYRPVIVNPYPEPLKVVYNYAGAPRIVVIPPLGSTVAEATELGVYSFTAMVLNTVGAIINVAVGNFNGGGYVPGPGQQPPAPPPPPVQYENVPVQVKYSNAVYEPFVVQRIVDVGMDPAVGAQKVLLDGVTPAWGAWVQTEDGQRQFEVRKTQQFPGLDAPSEGPLPGDYQLQLASANEPTSPGTRDLLLIGGAALVLLLGLGGIVLNVVLGRRHPRH